MYCKFFIAGTENVILCNIMYFHPSKTTIKIKRTSYLRVKFFPGWWTATFWRNCWCYSGVDRWGATAFTNGEVLIPTSIIMPEPYKPIQNIDWTAKIMCIFTFKIYSQINSLLNSLYESMLVKINLSYAPMEGVMTTQCSSLFRKSG